MTLYKLFTSQVASVDAAAQLDIVGDGVITAMWGYSTMETADALNDGFDFEVSFASTSGFQSNDTRASIFGIGARQNFLTSGGGAPTAALSVSGVRIPVLAGERLYMHTLENGSITGGRGTFWMFVDDGLDVRPSPRRRA